MYFQPYEGVSFELYDGRNLMDLCEKYNHFYVIGYLSNGTQVEGIITDMDDDGVTMLVPEIVDEGQLIQERQNGWNGGFGYGGYGRRYRRFRRRRYPYQVFVFPFILPFPFYY